MSSNPPGQEPRSFETLVADALAIITEAIQGEWSTINRLDEIAEPVYVKNPECVLVHVNEAFNRFFSPEVSPVGRNASAFLPTSIVPASQHSDELIIDGTTTLEFEHIGLGPDGSAYRIRTHKQSLAHFGNPGIALLGVSRVLAAVSDPELVQKLDLIEQHRRFRALDETDREIAKQISKGQKVRVIADSLGLTTRAVEQRKKKTLAAFELDQTLDLVKLLVRMQDRGFVDLGL